MNPKLNDFLGIEIKKIPINTPRRFYYFNTGIFLGVIVLSLILAIIIISSYGFDYDTHYYVKCNNSSQCYNNLYQAYPTCLKVAGGSLCELEFLPAGFIYGTPTPFIIKYWEWFILGLLS